MYIRTWAIPPLQLICSGVGPVGEFLKGSLSELVKGMQGYHIHQVVGSIYHKKNRLIWLIKNLPTFHSCVFFPHMVYQALQVLHFVPQLTET